MLLDKIAFPGLGLKFDIDPVAFRLFGGKEIYWYGIIIVTGLIIAVALAIFNGKKVGISSDKISDYMLITVPLAIIGARLYYVIFTWDSYKDNPLEIIKIWNGGLAIYGAVIVSVITMCLYCRKNDIKTYDFLDVGAVSLILGQAIGRWGNFMNAEAHGGETKNLFRMGITEYGEYIEVHPTFLYESVWNKIGFVILLLLFRKWRKFSGEVFWGYVFWYGLGRFFIEGLRTDSLMLGPVRVSQILSAVMVLAAAFMFFKRLRAKKSAENDKNTDNSEK